MKTGQYIASELKNQLEELDLSTDGLTITTDGGSNMLTACTSMGVQRLPCFAHLLNLVVSTDSIEKSEISSIFTAISKLVKNFKKSDGNTKLELAQKLAKKKPCLSPVQRVKTRCNSSYLMAARFVLLYEFFAEVKPSVKNSPRLISREELAIIQDCLPLLKPFEEATRNISGDSYSTTGMVLPLAYQLAQATEQCAPITTAGKELKRKLLAAMESRFAPIEEIDFLGKASLVDPRFRGRYFRSSILREEYIEQLIAEIVVEDSASGQNGVVVMKEAWDSHDAIVPTSGAIDPTTDGIMTNFLNEPLSGRLTDPFKSLSDSRYDGLKLIAAKYLLPPASSVSSERAASALNLIVPSLRCRLKDENINMRLLMSSVPGKYLDKAFE